jgi:hypothetical protein
MGNRFLHDLGFSFIEIVVAMAITTIVLGGVLATFDLVNSNSAQYSLVQARNEIINKIRVQSLNPDNLVASAKITDTLGAAGIVPDYGLPNNILHSDLLKKCIPEVGGTETYGCSKVKIDEPGKGFLFYLAENGVLDSERTVAGEDVYYKNTGMRCSSLEAESASSCPLAARVWFEPFCLNFASSCTKAMSLAVRYAIGLRSDFKTDSAIPSIEGEFYVPLQRGIQIRNLLNQLDVPLAPNSKGIFAIPKYYGLPGQTVTGLRFETVISNPFGLVSMRVQMRSLVGSDAKGFDDSVVPSELLALSWTDLPTPGNVGLGPWSIDLKGAVANQVFNFGTQLNVSANSRTIAPNTATSFVIGTASGILPLSPTYHWTLDGTSTAFVAPSFKSGIYQFRVVASDVMNGEVESTNYVTVRLIATPEYKFSNLDLALQRDCVDTMKTYNLFIGDDEAITAGQVKLGDQLMPVDLSGGTSAKVAINFLRSQPAGSYSINLVLKNRFSDVAMETALVPKVNVSETLTLKDISPSTGPGILANPSKIRIGTEGQVVLNYTTGNCCSATPSIGWDYLSSVYFGGGPILSGPATSTMSCTVSANTRTCSSTISVKGIVVGPSMTMPPKDISANLGLGASASDPACSMNPAPAAYTLSKYIPVVQIPNIGFYLPESLWITSPGTQLKPFVPRVVVRADFAPAADAVVEVVNAANTAQIFCTLTFLAGSSVNAIDKFCNIPAGFSGEILLQKGAGTTNVKTAIDPIDPQHVAKIEENIFHRMCQTNLTSAPGLAAKYKIPATLPMYDSPYGFTMVDDKKVQDPKNDTGFWTAGTEKNLRCYDQWSNLTLESNNQDYYEVYKYNFETIVANGESAINQALGGMEQPIPFAKFLVPNNPPLIVDPSAMNLPFVFMVLQEGAAGRVYWDLREEKGSQASTAAQDWEDITPQLCAGSSALSKIKLLKTRLSVESSSINIIMKAANSFYTMGMEGYYSYAFTCTYGRWHPSGSSYTNWTD